MNLLYVALGGAGGAMARYGLEAWVRERTGLGFPWGTLVVNVLGSFLLGVVLSSLVDARFSDELRALLAIGLLGAFTTFSTFSYEIVHLLASGAWGRALTYAAGSLLLGIAAVWIGLAVGGKIVA